jgi:hypothetical protein
LPDGVGAGDVLVAVGLLDSLEPRIQTGEHFLYRVRGVLTCCRSLYLPVI